MKLKDFNLAEDWLANVEHRLIEEALQEIETDRILFQDQGHTQYDNCFCDVCKASSEDSLLMRIPAVCIFCFVDSFLVLLWSTCLSRFSHIVFNL